eukprot:173817-Prymnesium_polylepis.1
MATCTSTSRCATPNRCRSRPRIACATPCRVRESACHGPPGRDDERGGRVDVVIHGAPETGRGRNRAVAERCSARARGASD